VRYLTSNPAERLLAIRSRAYVRGAERDATALAEMLVLLHVPATLLGGKRIAGEVCNLLQMAVSTASTEECQIVRTHIRELQWILRHTDRLALLLFDNPSERQKFLRVHGGNPYVSEGAHEHGLCSMLWEKYPPVAVTSSDGRQNLSSTFNALRTQATLSHFVALRHWVRTDDWSSTTGPRKMVIESMYRRTLAVRHFAMNRYRETPAYRGALAQVPLTTARTDFAGTLRLIRLNLPQPLNEVEAQLRKDLASIRRLLLVAEDPTSLCLYTKDESEDEDAQSDIPDTNPPPALEPTDGKLYDVGCQTEDDEDETEEPEETDARDHANGDAEAENGEISGNSAPGVTYTRHRWSEQEIKDCMEAGIHPADLLRSDTLHLSSRRSGDSQAAAQAMANQNLSIAWNNLDIEEACVCLQILEAGAHRSRKELEIFALTKTVLARGFTLGTAQAIEARVDRPSDVKCPTLLLSLSGQPGVEWLLPAVPIPYHQEHGHYSGCRRTVKWFASQDYWRLGDLLRKLIAVKFPEWQGEPILPFAIPIGVKDKPSSYRRRLKFYLENAESDRGSGLAGRVTFERLGRVLPQRIYDLTAGNLALVTYATLRKNPTGEDDRYYATPAVRSVQQAEYSAVASIEEEFRMMGYQSSINLDLVTSESSGYLGSPMCPTRIAIKQFLDGLILRIAELNAILNQHHDRNAFIARHNTFTILTFFATTLGSCHRPSHGCVPDLASIDTLSGRLSIADKGADKARLGVVAHLAVAQLRAYKEYVKSFGFADNFGSHPNLPFFVIGQDGNYVPVSLASLAQQGLPFVANFARHFVKTTFDEWSEDETKYVCQEWISAHLGHFTTGEEQFGRFSTFDYKQFGKCMREALDALLRELNLMPIDIQGKQITIYEPHVQRFLETGAH
jgi:hypothetical protein